MMLRRARTNGLTCRPTAAGRGTFLSWTDRSAVNTPPSRACGLSFFDTFPEIVITVGTMTAEGDRVAVEVTSRGVLRGGEPYRNHFHNLFVIDSDKIRLFKEYPTGYTGD